MRGGSVVAALVCTLSACSLFLGEGLSGGGEGASPDAASSSADVGPSEPDVAAPPPPREDAAGDASLVAPDASTDAGDAVVAGIEVNGSFEQGSIACGAGWEGNNANGVLSLVTTARTGERACRVCGSGVGIGIARRFAEGAMPAGQYAVTFWIRAESGNGPGFYATYAQAYDDQGNPAQVSYVSRITPAPAPTWVPMQMVLTVPAGRSLARLAWYFDDGAMQCVLVDDVTLVRAM